MAELAGKFGSIDLIPVERQELSDEVLSSLLEAAEQESAILENCEPYVFWVNDVSYIMFTRSGLWLAVPRTRESEHFENVADALRFVARTQ